MVDALVAFLAVAESGNFAKVARAQGVAVSSVTRKIDALERELRTRLFIRGSRRVMLTDEGTLLLSHARKIVDDVAEAKETLSAINMDPRGVLAVTAPASFGRRHVVPAVVSFLKQYPQIEIDLHLSDAVLDLGLRRVDVAIRMGSPPAGNLIATSLAPLRRLTCASPEYLAQRGRPTSPDDLLRHNCLTVSSAPVPPGWWRYTGVHRDTPLPVRGTLRTDDTDALLHDCDGGANLAVSGHSRHIEGDTGDPCGADERTIARCQSKAVYHPSAQVFRRSALLGTHHCDFLDARAMIA
jgi:DNA-binding transcriptional LysR family regulator